jgi:hypothetical protein
MMGKGWLEGHPEANGMSSSAINELLDRAKALNKIIMQPAKTAIIGETA